MSNENLESGANHAVLSSALAAVLFVASSAAQARIINAASPSSADVTKAIASAVDGDTVIVPAGTAAWTSGVTITKSITIQGQTTVNSDDGTANDLTVLVDNLTYNGGGHAFFSINVPATKPFRLTGITFTNGSRPETLYNGAIAVGGQTDKVRIDHLHFTGPIKHNNYIAVYSTVYGVADHLVLDNMGSQLGQNRVFNGTGYGDLEFAQPADYGSNKFFFFEDCYINNAYEGGSASGGVDALRGARFVVRHCHLYNVVTLCHGTENDRSRGGRAQEIYGNDFHWSYRITLDGIRSGTIIFHDNTFAGVLPDGVSLQTYRLMLDYGSGPWFGASGDSPWDVNVTEPDGTHIDGHPPYLFQSGTVTSATADPNAGFMTLTDTSKNWATNQWAYYTTHKVGDRFIGLILSNTNNTLTMRCLGGSFHAGDQYQIHKVLIALDQPGRGQGDLISGDPPTPVAWPHQRLEPCYSWNNIHAPGGEHINFNPAQSTADTVRQGRDYFNDTPMPGYTPYTYPHPLTRSQPPPEPRASSPQTQKKKKKWGKAKKSRPTKWLNLSSSVFRW
jgi:hypothetical protein